MTENNTQTGHYNEFWQWFQGNEERLFNIEENLESSLQELQERIAQVNSVLAFEIRPVDPTGKRQFIISADGIRQGFQDVRGLAGSAPDLKRWDIIPFRPKEMELSDVELSDPESGKMVRISPSEIKYLMINDSEEGKIGLVVYIPVNREISEDMAQRFVYLFLDQSLGEYDVETKLGSVFIAPAGAERYEQARPLEELGDHLEQVLRELEDTEGEE